MVTLHSNTPTAITSGEPEVTGNVSTTQIRAGLTAPHAVCPCRPGTCRPVVSNTGDFTSSRIRPSG